MRQARETLGLRTNRQLQAELAQYRKALEKKMPGAVAVNVTPYKDNVWMVYHVDESCREQVRPFDAQEFRLEPEQFARRYATITRIPTNDRREISELRYNANRNA
jgi:hypothetical protein